MAQGPFHRDAAGLRHARYLLAVLLVAYTLSFLDRSLLSLLIAPVKADLGLSDTGISLLLGFAFAIFYTLMGLPLGLLADRGNRRNLVAAGIAVWSAMTAACGFTTSFAGLFAARIGVGIGEATLSPAAYSMLSDSFPRERLGRAMALYSIGLPLGSGLALLLGGTIISAAGALGHLALPWIGALPAWRMSFLIVGLSGLVVVVLMLSVREPARRTDDAANSDNPLGLLAFLQERRAAISTLFGGIALFVLVIYGNMAWTPAFLARTYGLSVAEIGTQYGLITALCGAGGLLAGGMAADRLFARGVADAHLRVILFSVVLCWPLFVATPLMPNAGGAMVLLALGGVAATLHGGIAGAALQLMTPGHLRARMTALYFLVANLIGLGLGPTLVALVTDYVLHDEASLRYAMAGVSAVVLPASALILTLGLKPFARAVRAND